MWTEESGMPPPAWKSSWRGRPIKFRGRGTESGKFVYAELGEVSAEIRPDYLTFINDDGIFTVDHESIAQLVGYDANGHEVYEGDILIDDDDTCRPLYKEFVVSFKVHGRKHGMVVDFETKPSRYRLKEAAQ